MAAAETLILPVEQGQSPPSHKKRNRTIAVAAMAALGFAGAIMGVRPPTNNPEQATDIDIPRPASLLEFCQYILNSRDVRLAFSEKLPGATLSADECRSRTDPVEQSVATIVDPTSRASVQLAITDRTLDQGSDLLTYMREQIQLGRVPYQEISAVGESQASVQSIGSKAGTVIMYYSGFAVSVSYDSYNTAGSQNIASRQQATLDFARVIDGGLPG